MRRSMSLPGGSWLPAVGLILCSRILPQETARLHGSDINLERGQITVAALRRDSGGSASDSHPEGVTLPVQ